MRQPTYVALLLVAASALAGGARAFEAPPVAGDPGSAETNGTEFFEQQIRPLLADHCVACHGPKKQEGSLRLDSRARLLAGGDGGSVVDLAQPAASRLLKAIRRDDAELEMPPPPAVRLTDPQIAAVEHWITAGAPWPSADDRGASAPPTAREHWAFQRIESQQPPTVRDTTWPTSPVDLFVLARLEAEGLTPAPTVDRRALLRRATYDLIGIAPREDEIAAFVADPDPRAFARLVDRLLDSPLYGQRWGRYWLDVARYADTKGYVRLKEERRFHYAFTYRDWVIRALNEDLPFDQFIEQQLAADLLPTADNRALAALGFLALGRQFTGNQQDIIDDRIDVVCRGLLGLTVTCARCHDHKYDPIPTADYYSLYGIFGTCEEPVMPPLTGPAMTDTASVDFERETQKRKQALDDYEPQAYRELLNDFRRQAGQYLSAALAGHVPLQQPLPKVAGEIRQVVANRWVEFLANRDERDPVFGPWHVLCAAGVDGFAPVMTRLVAGWSNPDAAAPGASVNRLVQQRLLS
ncbi:MAG TPA: DUF1549 domain-containing protein, partial [Pirellulales bacterium]|nr:DUF1549 domain-containing protein [Pirellulales bacterium]